LYHLNPALKRWAIIKIENEIGRSYRALARERKGHDYWFWIGTHGDYNNRPLICGGGWKLPPRLNTTRAERNFRFAIARAQKRRRTVEAAVPAARSSSSAGDTPATTAKQKRHHLFQIRAD